MQRVIVTHVDFPSTFYEIEDQKKLVAMGAFMEHCYTTPATGKTTWEIAIAQIKAIGASRVVIGTDLGQPAGVFPDEGMAIYVEKLLAAGFSEKDVVTMIAANPASLVE